MDQNIDPIETILNTDTPAPEQEGGSDPIEELLNKDQEEQTEEKDAKESGESSEPEKKPETGKAEKKPRNKEAEVRIGQLIGKNKALQAELDEIKSKMALDQEISTIEKPQRPKKSDFVDSDGYPDQEAFEQALSEYPEKLLEYNNKLGEIRAKKETKANEPNYEQIREEFEIKETSRKAAERVIEAQRRYGEDRLKDAINVVSKSIPQSGHQFIIRSPYIAEISLVLASDQRELERFSNMGPYDIGPEIGKLEARIEAAKNKRTSAPPPTGGVKPNSGPAGPQSLDDIAERAAKQF